MISQLAEEHVRSFNPHTKLEYAKMTIRAKALDINARLRKKLNAELKTLSEDIATNTRLLATYHDLDSQETLSAELNTCITRRNAILAEQGQKLAFIAKTRWYNEGERSNKYFLNLLKRQSEMSEMTVLNIEGNETTDELEIKREVENFYKKLYNHNHVTDIQDDLLKNMFVVDPEINDVINSPITLHELWLALRPLKATTPGPDGISNTYLKKLWDIIGPIIVDAWNYSIERDELCPSHKSSFLRLIPKAGKDTKLLKNWRPITLSNCDHKLITRAYNNRVLSAINDHIIPIQTAYLKGRNIADNLRCLNSLVKMSTIDDTIDATVIALDAQKAFDSVSHEYITKVIERIGMSNFNPIFKLLYKDLQNDILINGKISGRYKLGNGVKQGDALSCSLFVLAIEPVIRNILNNPLIDTVTSNMLNYTWPKVLAYADDITIITKNDHESVKNIFTEYQKLSCASGLYLNADKTEKFNIYGRNVANPVEVNEIEYNNTALQIRAIPTIKINGVIFNTDVNEMATANYELMFTKMDNHFRAWSKRSLSLLGKIQIIKTFGLSQYLYPLAVIDINLNHWAQIYKTIFKFLWNKNYNGNRAPHRIKKDVIYTEPELGGFGLVKLEDVVTGIRLRRFAILEDGINHPIGVLQQQLGSRDFLRDTPRYLIDPTTSSALKLLSQQNLKQLETYIPVDIHHDRLGCQKLMHTKIVNVCVPNRRNSIEYANLRRQGIQTLFELYSAANINRNDVLRICYPSIRGVLAALLQLPVYQHDGQPLNCHLYITGSKKWQHIGMLTSRVIRAMIYPNKLITNTKLANLEEADAVQIYSKIKKLRNVPLRTKMLRLLNGDVYCGSRLVKFNMSDCDRCIRCFQEETIKHLLQECPFSTEVWDRLQIDQPSAHITNIIKPNCSDTEFEVIANVIEQLVFKKTQTTPNAMIRTTVEKLANGLNKDLKITRRAKHIIDNYGMTNQWEL